MLKKKFISKILSLIFTIVLFFISIQFFIKKEISLLLYVVFVYIVYLILLYFEYKKGYKIETYIKVLIVSSLIIDIVWGFYFDMYHTSNWFDKLMHLFGCFCFTLVLVSIIHSYVKILSPSKIIIFIFITSLGVTSGVFYEFIEFGLDVVIKTQTQNGLVDTNLDLLFDTFGSMAAAGLVLYKKVGIYIQ
ncbi:hypothetical protein [Crassaminicella profunda]|uniref:hypothetical protein n=1 Tax=Crassaminicella profunda TaxID=1286698 RepID=UPI001CA650EF|nr:hypothetical protein [Crassaminicella profunda]QZY53624.1 hypothetical protein K7H06_11175 [Crassaminicella profunda]